MPIRPTLTAPAPPPVIMAQPATARERLIVALDRPGADEALVLVNRLGDSCQWYKVGLELYLAAGNAIVQTLFERGFSVFLDLKLHDIPNTVAGAVASAARLAASFLTIHASGGPAMLRAAVEAAQSQPSAPQLLAVTVLTSMDPEQLHAVGVEVDAATQVARLGSLGFDCGIRGFVCSAQEVAAMRSLLGPDAILVVPGIRPAGAAAGDQRRMATPAAAIRDGASYLVVGRPISQAADPLAAATAVLAEIESALDGKSAPGTLNPAP